jgi:rhodanese-related sulfurtransferase
MASFNEKSVSALSRLIGTPECPVLLDVRIDEDFNDDPSLIPGAVRHAFMNVASLAYKLKGKSVVVYCQKGLKISQGGRA